MLLFMIPHTTLLKFDYPQSVIAEYTHWDVMLRPMQPTLGSLVLVARSDVLAFSDLPAEAFSELSFVTKQIECALKDIYAYDKINYLMLMMVDPHVHFHVIPRYAKSRVMYGVEWSDSAWGSAPALGHDVKLTKEARMLMLSDLKSAWLRQGKLQSGQSCLIPS